MQSDGEKKFRKKDKMSAFLNLQFHHVQVMKTYYFGILDTIGLLLYVSDI